MIEGTPSRQAQLTFVMARHALIDLGQVFRVQERKTWQSLCKARSNRLPSKDFYHLCEALGENHLAAVRRPRRGQAAEHDPGPV